MRKGKKLAKRCLIHWLRPPPPTHTHTHSDTHNMTLHTGLMLTIWISTNARSKSNSQWLTPTGSSKQYSASRYIVFAALHDLDKPISESGIDTCAIDSGT